MNARRHWDKVCVRSNSRHRSISDNAIRHELPELGNLLTIKVMADFSRSSDLNTTAIEFLITDLETALVFMDVAQASGDQEVKQRNHKNAHVAYDTVIRLLSKVKPTAAQQRAIDERLTLFERTARSCWRTVLTVLSKVPMTLCFTLVKICIKIVR